ncbi:hypothetical protein BG004_000576 [Podila humilis]|nr:hypothetical protein BG004_000576 [Podila humilis]
MDHKLDADEYASRSQRPSTPNTKTDNMPELDTNAILKCQWQQLNHITSDAIASILKKAGDKEWVLAQCVNTVVPDDIDTTRQLLEHGLFLTESTMDSIITRSLNQRSSKALLAAQLTEQEVLACKYRWYLIKYLNRLATHQELVAAEKQARAREEARIARIQKPRLSHKNSDAFDPLRIIEQEPEPASNVPLVTGTYHSFRDMDLAGQACIFAEAGFIEGVRILFTRHNIETWPWRLAIVGRIPETCSIETYKTMLPQINPKTGIEQEWLHDKPWRDMDWVEVTELRTLVFGSPDHEMDSYMAQVRMTTEERKAAHGGDEAAVLDMVAIHKETEELLPSPESFPGPAERLSQWYIERALTIDRDSGQMIDARRLVQWGISSHIPNLETISEDLEILCKILYEIKPESRTPTSRALWTKIVLDLSLQQFSQMNPMEVVRLCLATSDQLTIVQDIRQLVLPYLNVIIPRRWQRHDQLYGPGVGLPAGLDPSNPMSYLYAYLLGQSPDHLSWVGAVVEASKPVYELEERILRNDMDLSWLTLSCMYGCRRVDEWKVMSDMIVCLPMFEQTEQVDEAVHKVRRAELRKDIFVPGGGDVQPAINGRPRISPQVEPLQMYPAFIKYAPTPGLMQHALDTLEQHLTAAETLARYDLPVPLSWFLENSDSEASQQQMITKMARLASGGPEKMGERFESEDEWMLLLEDLIRLRGGENGGGVLGLVSEQDIYREYLAGVLSCGKFRLAKAILFPPGLLPPLRLATAEKLVIDSSNDMYNNATNGNRHQGLMKMAYECLQVLPETTNIRREMDLIEATHFMTSTYNLNAPNSTTKLLPLQIRTTGNKLSLVRQLILTKENAYRDHDAMMELAIKLTGSSSQKKAVKQQIEIQVVGMLIEAALKEHNYVFAIQQSGRLMNLLRVSGFLDMQSDSSPKMKRLAKSSSFTDPDLSFSTSQNNSNTSNKTTPTSAPVLQVRDSPGSNQWNGLPEPTKPWELFLRVGSESVGKDYAKRLSVIGCAMASCPADKIETVLEIWRSIEMESMHAPAPEVDPRRGVVGFMSTMMDRTSSGPSFVQAMDRSGGQVPLAESIGRSYSPMSGDSRRENSMASEHGHLAAGEGGRRRDKLKSLVGSIWNAS